MTKRPVEEGGEEEFTNLGVNKKAKHKEHGNYDRYYGYRKTQGGEKGSKSEDVRLDLLKVRIATRLAWFMSLILSCSSTYL